MIQRTDVRRIYDKGEQNKNVCDEFVNVSQGYLPDRIPTNEKKLLGGGKKWVDIPNK